MVLEFRGCADPRRCCCPCTYNVWRNDELVGIANETTFTDPRNVATGNLYHYRVRPRRRGFRFCLLMTWLTC